MWKYGVQMASKEFSSAVQYSLVSGHQFISFNRDNSSDSLITACQRCVALANSTCYIIAFNIVNLLNDSHGQLCHSGYYHEYILVSLLHYMLNNIFLGLIVFECLCWNLQDRSRQTLFFWVVARSFARSMLFILHPTYHKNALLSPHIGTFWPRLLENFKLYWTRVVELRKNVSTWIILE